MNLSENIVTKRIMPDGSNYAVAAGAADINSDIVDTSGYEGCRFIIGFGAITSGAATSIKVQQNTANAASGMADLEGSSITITDANDNKIAIAEVHLPRERYLRLTTLRATQNSVSIS